MKDRPVSSGRNYEFRLTDRRKKNYIDETNLKTSQDDLQQKISVSHHFLDTDSNRIRYVHKETQKGGIKCG